MGKKYNPSGYQIIDLGEHDLSSTVQITSFDNPELQSLHDYIDNLLKNGQFETTLGKEIKYLKPLFISIFDIDAEIGISGLCVLSSCVQTSDNILLSVLSANNQKIISLQINVIDWLQGDKTIDITKTDIL